MRLETPVEARVSYFGGLDQVGGWAIASLIDVLTVGRVLGNEHRT